MHTLNNVGAKLRVSKSALNGWRAQGVLEFTKAVRGGQEVVLISEAEVERINQMMYPHGLPKDGAYPLNHTTVVYAVNRRVRIGWLPYLHSWGLLRAGLTPARQLVINDAHVINDALFQLQTIEGAMSLCANHAATNAEIVQKVKELVETHLNSA